MADPAWRVINEAATGFHVFRIEVKSLPFATTLLCIEIQFQSNIGVSGRVGVGSRLHLIY